MSVPILRVSRVGMRFGGIVALNDVSLDIQPGSIHAVIGPNGAGKSTLLNVITGIYRPSAGEVHFEGASMNGLAPHQICRQGICRTFQNTELFGEMSALENVLVGMHRSPEYGFAQAILQGRRYVAGEEQSRQHALRLLETVGLADDRHTQAYALPFGKQRRLEIARALAAKPKLLLLDEPAAGLRGAEIDALNAILLRLNEDQKLTILVIDHVMALVMKVSHYITVLNFGQKIAEGGPEDVRQSPAVIEAYLGKRRRDVAAS